MGFQEVGTFSIQINQKIVGSKTVVFSLVTSGRYTRGHVEVSTVNEIPMNCCQTGELKHTL